MNRQEFFNIIKTKKSFLCIGLDSDISKIPKHLLNLDDPIFEFNKKIIDSTLDLAVAYKINTAFYESCGLKGWRSLEKTVDYLNKYKEQIFTIADAKRGDIGNTSKQYAKEFFDPNSSGLDFDAVTVNPYMGEDCITPFYSFKGKWVILLILTSNKGAYDFQFLQPQFHATLEKLGIKIRRDSNKKLFEQVMAKSYKWGGNENNTMFVIGANNAEIFSSIRNNFPEHFFLVPGVGAQGGNLLKVAKYGLNKQCGLLVNSSRKIIFASKGLDFAVKAKEQAIILQKQMERILKANNIL